MVSGRHDSRPPTLCQIIYKKPLIHAITQISIIYSYQLLYGNLYGASYESIGGLFRPHPPFQPNPIPQYLPIRQPWQQHFQCPDNTP